MRAHDLFNTNEDERNMIHNLIIIRNIQSIFAITAIVRTEKDEK